MASRVGSKVSRLLHEVISRVVEAPVRLATTKAKEREELPQSEQWATPNWEQPEQLIEPTLEQPEPQKNFTNLKASPGLVDKVGRGGDGHDEALHRTQIARSTVPEVKLEDVLTPREEKPPTKVNSTPAVSEKAIPLEVLKKIYARHLEALKILNSEAVDEQKKNEK